MDGLEWKRAKWSFFVKQLTKWFEKLATKNSNYLISDNKGIQDYIKKKYNKESVMIPYGADKVNPKKQYLVEYNVTIQDYFLLIARLEPENNIEMILDGYLSSESTTSFLVVGNTETSYGKYLKDKYIEADIVFLGGIFNKEHLDSLRKFAKVYFHGHSVGGTNPALLEAMGAVTEEEDNVESLSDLSLDEENIQKLSNKGIKNKDDLAELSIDELKEIIDITEEDASKMIMKAREHWFN